MIKSNFKPWACERCRSTVMTIRPSALVDDHVMPDGSLIASCDNGHPAKLKRGDVIQIVWSATLVEVLFANAQ